MEKKVELLAPAGNYECLQAAINAGADAIYLGGEKFSARAFAGNFSNEELIRGITYAHLFHVKIYLTVNTLVKEKEFDALYEFIKPFYEAGLDGVIIQDFGVFSYLQKAFPNLELHASTQMTLTGVDGARLLKKMGACRIVPARELSLKEIAQIKEEVDIEIESFIHGAMCYCYSGQCLFSSIVGGRSGNRGRCAQPCRLPYEAYRDGRKMEPNFLENEKTPNFSSGNERKKGNSIALNRKEERNYTSGKNSKMVNKKNVGEMNGKNHGAFGKNAGRMSNDRKFGRNASYSGKNAAGNDRNFEKNAVYNGKGADANKAAEMYPLSLKDMCTIEHIHQLIEAGISSFKIEGRMKSKEYVAGVTAIYRKYIDQYYKTKKAVSIESQDLEVLNHLYIRSQRQDGYYFKHNGKDMVTLQNPAYASCEDRIIKQIDDTYLKQNRKKLVCAYFTAIQNEPITLCVSLGQEIVVTKSGVEASEALNRPMTAADFEKQLKKTGDTYFAIDELEVHVEGKVFVPVKEINALRRAVFDEILEAFLKADTADRVGKAERPEAKSETLIKSKIEPEWRNDGEALQIYALVHTSEQLDAVVKNRGVERIYLDGELFTQISTIGGEFALPPTKDACIENVKAFTQSKENDYNKEQEWYLALPYVKRARSAKAFEKYWNMLELPYITGVLVRSMDELGWLLEKNYLGQVVLDAGIYCWNQETKNYWENFWNRQNNPKPLLFTAPVELNKKELSDLSIQNMEVVAYGRLPMMISAGCIYKTFDACSPQPGFRAPLKLKDRLGKEFPVVANCAHCYNIIYNTTPLSLHQAMDEMQRMQAKAIRLSFTVESGAECRKIVDGFSGALFEKEEEALFYLQNKEYTNGHFKRGVE